MKYKIIVGLALIILGSCGGENAAKTADMEKTVPITEHAVKPAFANAKDPTCGMDADASWTDTAQYNNQVYGFCSPTCKREFLTNPEEALKKGK